METLVLSKAKKREEERTRTGGFVLSHHRCKRRRYRWENKRPMKIATQEPRETKGLDEKKKRDQRAGDPLIKRGGIIRRSHEKGRKEGQWGGGNPGRQNRTASLQVGFLGQNNGRKGLCGRKRNDATSRNFWIDKKSAHHQEGRVDQKTPSAKKREENKKKVDKIKQKWRSDRV